MPWGECGGDALPLCLGSTLAASSAERVPGGGVKIWQRRNLVMAKCGTAKLCHILPWCLRAESICLGVVVAGATVAPCI